MNELERALAKAKAEEITETLPPGMRSLLARVGANGRGISRAQLKSQVARRRAQIAAADPEPPTPKKKPKPKKKAKTPVKSESMDALAASLAAKPKRKAKHARASAESHGPDPKLLAYLDESWGFESSDERKSQVAGQQEAESISKMCFELTGTRSTVEMVKMRDAARAKAMGLEP